MTIPTLSVTGTSFGQVTALPPHLSHGLRRSPTGEQDLVREVTADSYALDFLAIDPGFSERQLIITWGTFLNALRHAWGTFLNAVGVSQPTVTRHVNYLRDAYLLWRCPQLEKEWIPRDRAQEKLYPIDPLIARLPHLRHAARADIDPTVLAEAQIGTALRRAALRERSTWDSDSALFHVRTTTRKEIDCVAAEFSGAAVEGKYTDGGSWRSEAQTVDASSYRGILTTRSVLDVSATDGGAWAVPAALLAVLVDG
jgi:predicted AAA+ superfamily ATPase